MRILHVVPSIGPLRGGPSFVVRTLAGGLNTLGFKVDVATTDDNLTEELSVSLNQPLREGGVTYWYFRRQTELYLFSAPFARWLWQHVREYDLVHIHALFSWPANIAAYIARRSHVPYIIRPLGVLNRWGMEHRRPWLKKISFAVCERQLLEAAAAVHYTSEQEREEAEALKFSARAAIIPNPVQLDGKPAQFSGAIRTEHPRLQGKVVFLFLSRVHQKKGIDLLLRAFARAAAEVPYIALLIAGDGPHELVDQYRRQTRALQLDDRVVWTGFVDGKRKLAVLDGADVFVLSSYSENFGIAVVEAMRWGLPVIVSDKVGISSEITAHGAGIVTACEEISLSRALISLATDPAQRRTMADSACRLANAHYSSEAVCARIATLYRDILGRTQ